MSECLTCGRDITVVFNRRRPRRKWCDYRCRRAAFESRDEEVEFLLGMGESPDTIASQFGLRPGSLGRWLLRHERGDLAREFFRAERREKAAA